jgi:tetratricopeptide (TPR) repeat protein
MSIKMSLVLAGDSNMSDSRADQVMSFPVRQLQTYVQTKDRRYLDSFIAIVDGLCIDGHFEYAFEVCEEAINTFPNDPEIYYWAAEVCKAWSDKLADIHFIIDPKRLVGMELPRWMYEEDSPYRKVLELRRRAAEYLGKAIELSRNLPCEIRRELEEKILSFRWA